MKDFQSRFESLTREAAECDLIAKLATDKDKAAHFTKLAGQYRAMADDMREIIADLSSRPRSDP